MTYFLVFFGLFVLWATFAPIDSGVTVPGTVVVLGNRKQVQYPAAGVVEAILVREGSLVKKGDVLIRVNPLSSQANLSAAELDYLTALAAESRLLSERERRAKIQWLPDLQVKKDDPRARELMETQEKLFHWLALTNRSVQSTAKQGNVNTKCLSQVMCIIPFTHTLERESKL